ncbi:hypothetical protein ACGFYQ_20845 [Streptomyces sp. NPDC048258]|uniref:hypothetical protein n=1 Tax=Streptomyces sp. NPDC048258 TaxID=3365527 RepID=UPI003710F189
MNPPRLRLRDVVADAGPAFDARRRKDRSRFLDEAGAQLVVPTDRCGARHVSAVTHVWFGALSPPSPGL